MRVPKKKPTPPARPEPACYCVTDAQGTILHRIELEPGSQLGLQHFDALAYFVSATGRLDRLQAILTQWLVSTLLEDFGVWGFEYEDLVDFGALLQFLSLCHRHPTPTELENLMLGS